jgi:hypothetical protein
MTAIEASRAVTEPDRRVVVTALGVAQILAWGSSFYLLGVLANPIVRDTGWGLRMDHGRGIGRIAGRRHHRTHFPRINTSRPQKAKCVIHVSGTKCHLCLGPFTLKDLLPLL